MSALRRGSSRTAWTALDRRADAVERRFRISIVMAVATAISYWNVRTGLESQGLENLERYVEQRRDRESAIFQLASGNVATFATAYAVALQQTDLREAESRFAALFEERPDGTARIRESVFKMQSITGFIGRGAMIDRDLKRRLVAAVDLVAQFGPAWSRHFANLYVVTPEGAVVMYWPGEPWALNASDWEVSGKLALIGKPNEPVLVTGPPADAPADRETWSELYFDYGVSDWLVSVTRPVLSQGRHVASVGHDLMLHDLIDRTVSSNLKGTYNFLVSEQGRLIAHPQFMEAIQARSGVLLVEETGDRDAGAPLPPRPRARSRRDDRQGRGRRPIPRRDAHRRARLAARDSVPAIDRRGGRLDDGAADPDLGTRRPRDRAFHPRAAR